jgi:hypothetical protein
MDADLKQWQSKMAPFMVAAVIVMGLFFAVATIWKFGEVETRLSKSSDELSAVVWTPKIQPQSFDEQMQLARVQAAYNLETDLIARRYEQANVAFLSRLWTRFMGFITGMILALVGAAFVLGKLETDKSEVEGTAKGMSVAIRSTSPGLILAVLGAILMGLTIALPVNVSVRDGAIYFGKPSFDETPPFRSAGPDEPEPKPRPSPNEK